MWANTPQESKRAVEATGAKWEGEKVRPKVPLRACLDALGAPDSLADFFSTATGQRGTPSCAPASVRVCLCLWLTRGATVHAHRPCVQDDAPRHVPAVPASAHAPLWRERGLDAQEARRGRFGP